MKDISQCPTCGTKIKKETNSYHVWEIEYECGCKVWGAIDTKKYGNKINVISNPIN